MIAIFKREIRSYFTSPIGYVYVCAYLFITGLLFKLSVVDGGATISDWFSTSLLVYMFLVPILTMRLFSEEKKTKTDQILLTSPVSVTGIVLGKFFAAWGVYAIAVLLTLPNMIFVHMYGTLETGIVLGNYTAILLLGFAFVAIGCFLSAVTESQVVAAVLSFSVMMSLYFLGSISSSIGSEWIVDIISFISLYDRYMDFTQGLFSLSSIVYYLSIAVVFLFLTGRMIEKRRWSK